MKVEQLNCGVISKYKWGEGVVEAIQWLGEFYFQDPENPLMVKHKEDVKHILRDNAIIFRDMNHEEKGSISIIYNKVVCKIGEIIVRDDVGGISVWSVTSFNNIFKQIK